MTSCIPYVIALVLTVSTASGLECYSSSSRNYSEMCYSSERIKPQCYYMHIETQDGVHTWVYGCVRGPQFDCLAEVTRRGWRRNISNPAYSSVRHLRCDTCDDYSSCNRYKSCDHGECPFVTDQLGGQPHQEANLIGLLLTVFPFLFYFF